MSDEDEALGVEYVEDAEETPQEPEKPQDPPDPEAEEGPQGEDGGSEDGEDTAEFTEAQQAKLQAAIDRNNARIRRDYEKRLESESQRIQKEMETRYGTRQDEGPPEIPDLPDPFDDDFEGKVKARDEAIAKRGEWEADQRSKAAFQQERQREAQMQEFQGAQTALNTYFSRGDKAGIERGALESAGRVVGESALPGEIIGELVNDESGPEINVWLAKHPDELDKIAEMSPMRGWAYLDKTIRPKATRKRAAPPPEPADSPKGKGAPPSEDPEGWTLE